MPVPGRSGRIAFFERWDAAAAGVPVGRVVFVYGLYIDERYWAYGYDTAWWGGPAA